MNFTHKYYLAVFYYFKLLGYILFFSSILLIALIVLSWFDVLAESSAYPSWAIFGAVFFLIQGYLLKKIKPKALLEYFNR